MWVLVPQQVLLLMGCTEASYDHPWDLLTLGFRVQTVVRWARFRA